MDTNKMRDISREQFEGWYLEKHCGGIDRVKTCSNARDTYYYTDTQTKWVAWQASREAVVVELPALAEPFESELSAAPIYTFQGEGRNAAIAECREAIEAQDLRVAP